MSGFQPDPPLTYLDVLDQIAEAGFSGTELGDRGFMPSDPDFLLPELLQRGLAMVGAFTPLELTDPSQLTASMIGALNTGCDVMTTFGEAVQPVRFSMPGMVLWKWSKST